MESFPLFFRIRASAFTIIMLFSFLWLVLLSVEIFARWTLSDRISQSLMVVFILSNTVTLIVLPVLLLVEFRIWLDTARLFLLFLLQVGSAVAGTCWSPRIRCPDQNPDDIGVCQLISVYTLIASWIIPAILLLYSIYFTAVVYFQSRIPVVVEPKCSSDVDREMGSSECLSTWREMLKEIVGVQGSTAGTSVSPRPLVLPTIIQTGQTPLAQPSPPSQSVSRSSPSSSRHQSMIPSLPHTSRQQPTPSFHMPSRHHSFPAFKHGGMPRLRPLLTLPIPHIPANNPPSSHPQTPSSYSCSTPSSAIPLIQSFAFNPGVANAQSLVNHRWHSKHLSIMLPSSSLGDIQSTEASPTTRSMRAKLTKPLPAHLL